MCLYHNKYYICTKCKGSACNRVFKCSSHETSQNIKLSIRLLRHIFVMTFTETDFKDIGSFHELAGSSTLIHASFSACGINKVRRPSYAYHVYVPFWFVTGRSHENY